MNREILYRAKLKSTREWIYGLPSYDLRYIFNADNFDSHDRCEVISETIEQFTGLLDKNGNRIFEGDIVKSTFKFKDNFKEITGIVEEDTCNPCFVIHYKFEGNGHDCYEYDFIQCGLRANEIIGNIHDNLDLLK